MRRELLIVIVFLLLAYPAAALTRDEALGRIDWRLIENQTIILLTKQPFSPQYNIYVPSRADFAKFVKDYDFSVNVADQNGKKLFVVEEIAKRAPSLVSFSCIPAEVASAAKKLKAAYPSFVGFSQSQGEIDKWICPDIKFGWASKTTQYSPCCRWGELCCYYSKTGCCPCGCIEGKCVCD